jgi:hypothetical protein
VKPCTRELIEGVLGFSPGSAMPTTGYGGWLLRGLGMGRLHYGVQYPDETRDARPDWTLAGRVVRTRSGDPWDAAVVLASLAVDDPGVSASRAARHREALLACASVLLASGAVDVLEGP